MTTTTMIEQMCSGYAPFHRAKEGDTTFLTETDTVKAANMLAESRASKVYIHKSLDINLLWNLDLPRSQPGRLIGVDNPKLAFIRDMLEHRDLLPERSWYITQQNRIPSTTIIEQGCQIHFTTFGDHCHVYHNTTIGSPALGGERDNNGKIVRFPHIGRVWVGYDVHIGSQCNISRGTLDDTIIGNGVTMDDHVHIAHNCQIGERTQIAAGAVFGGSVIAGKDCWIGLNATINDHIELGDHVLVASGAMVAKDVIDFDIVAGVPAVSIKQKCHIPPERRYRMVGY